MTDNTNALYNYIVQYVHFIRDLELQVTSLNTVLHQARRHQHQKHANPIATTLQHKGAVSRGTMLNCNESNYLQLK